MEKLFTIYICTYNGEKKIGKCLDSILALQNINELVCKIVVIDNNSNDDTSGVVEAYSKKNNLVKYEFEPDQGLSNARKHAAFAETKWVIYVDDDNLLDSMWVVELERIVKSNPDLGVINGAVIAIEEEPFLADEKNCLSIIYRDLACTHIYSIDRGHNDNKIPMGAGLCVRTKALKKIADNGWLNLQGRTGINLSSGEDGELCELVLQQGYKYYFSTNMKLQHLIPRSRLQYDYVNKLIFGLVEGRIGLLRTHKQGNLECFLRKIKYTLLHLIYSKNKYKRSDKLYWGVEVRKMIIDSYLKLL